RLVPDDMLRPSGTAQWFKVGESPEFKPYVPQAEPYQIEDQTEALEDIQMDFTWKRRREDEDDDVDMIPLIDVSLVLLIFFMLTSAAATASSLINTPRTAHGRVIGKNDMFWINIDLPRGRGSDPVYSVSIGTNDAAPEDRDLNNPLKALDRFNDRLKQREGPVDVTIRAHTDVRSGDVRDVIDMLTRMGFTKVKNTYIAVGEKVQE